MAITDLTNLYSPQVWGDALAERLPVTSRMWMSGIIDDNPEYQKYINGPGSLFTIPILKYLSGRSQTLSANNTAQSGAVSSIVPKNQTTALMQVVRHHRGDGWAWKELAATIAGLESALGVRNRGFGESAEIKGDPLGALEDMLFEYWANDMQTTAIKVLKGVFSNSTMLAEHVSDKSIPTGTPTVANQISVANIVAAQQLLGDKRDNLGVIFMHSLQYSKLLIDNLITFLKIQQDLTVPTIAGLQVVVDDNVDIIPAAGAVPAKYSCYIMGQGAIAYAPYIDDAPVEIARDAAAGVDFIYTRMGFILQPKGISWVGSLAAGEFPTDAQLITGTNWSRVQDRKNVPVVQLIVN